MTDAKTLDDVLFAFHRTVTDVTPEVLKEWTTRYPEYADEIRAHAVEIADMELLASVRAHPLSIDADVVLESMQQLGGETPRVSIPANPQRDDDLLLYSYVAQQRPLYAALVFPKVESTPQMSAAAAMVGDDVDDYPSPDIQPTAGDAKAVRAIAVAVHDLFKKHQAEDLARIAALEAALIEVVKPQVKATYDDEGGVHWHAPGNIMAILDRLGLAHRLQGNPAQAEQVLP